MKNENNINNLNIFSESDTEGIENDFDQLENEIQEDIKRLQLNKKHENNNKKHAKNLHKLIVGKIKINNEQKPNVETQETVNFVEDTSSSSPILLSEHVKVLSKGKNNNSKANLEQENKNKVSYDHFNDSNSISGSSNHQKNNSMKSKTKSNAINGQSSNLRHSISNFNNQNLFLNEREENSGSSNNGDDTTIEFYSENITKIHEYLDRDKIIELEILNQLNCIESKIDAFLNDKH
ncbi:hypothetical protein EDEG_03849 [Edhazardia aedis USNM 41457]|uniref:Uncharacterized protein n=1 Tax=Edhazardia aedis (strain USNM 41457) TaxID=1003232 RepID=J9D1A2_EDHAE|nr:hypothetical protein EDEG_03849 [Edhazardia aedis USNM 41457]|eukprot:EJW01606.1 hypothetical protein EDEG_03849 [Edhazardia aedis USNM 41457]